MTHAKRLELRNRRRNKYGDPVMVWENGVRTDNKYILAFSNGYQCFEMRITVMGLI